MCFKTVHIIRKSVYNIFFIFMFVYLLFIFGWLIVFIRKCYQQTNAYKQCKNSTVFHPIYSDVKYLQKNRKLYNLKTHLVKYTIFSLCLLIEIMNILWFFLTDYIQANAAVPKNNSVILNFEKTHQNCHFHASVLKFYYNISYIIVYNVNYVFIFLLYCTISILSRYLAARYLNHSFTRTLIKYIIWILVQCSLIAVCSSIYTLPVSFLLYPIIFFINFIFLIRDSLILSSVLKLNLRELRLHGSKLLYKQQLKAFQFYRIFRGIYILSISLLLLCYCFLFFYKAIDLILQQNCIFEFLYNINIPSSVKDTLYQHRNALKGLECISEMISFMFLLIYIISLNVPLIGITIFPILAGIIKRWRAKEEQFRFNYENMEPFLRRRLIK